MALKESIFREYDIRGIAYEDLGREEVIKIAKSLAVIFNREKKTKIALGMDGRESSPEIKDIVKNILLERGFDIFDIGLVPSPLLYFTVYNDSLDGGIMVTASHNPGEYNGLKIMLGKKAIYGNAVKEIFHIAQKGDDINLIEGQLYDKSNIIEDYYSYVKDNIKIESKIKVVVDAGNGTAGVTAPSLYRSLGLDVVELYCDVDPKFPNHHPDPTVETNLEDLITKVKEVNADLGIAFDGDGDRIGVVGPKGEIIRGDMLTVIFARDILKDKKGAKIISEVKASQALYDDIKKQGGVPIMWKAGHSLIKEKIVKEGALLAGEMSGHIFFNDKWFGFDDAVYAGARLMEIMSKDNKSLLDLLEGIPTLCNTPEIRFDCKEEIKFDIVKGVKNHFKDKYEIIDIDGARIIFPFGWALVRASNTQPSLVIRYEGESKEALDEIEKQVMPVVKSLEDELS